MLSTKSKIQLLTVLLNDIKNDVSKYSNEATFDSLGISDNNENLFLRIESNKNDILLSFDEKGKLVANTGNETKDIAIERKYKINWLLKLFSFLILFSFITTLAVAQTPPTRTWYENNRGVKTTVKERWDENSQGQKHGTYIKYFEDGEREILGYYKNDIPNGQWEITVYSNLLFQQVKSITYVNFLNGQEHGLYKTVSGGIVLVQGNYTNGVKTGYWKEDYDLEEKVYSEGNYVNGKRDGEWKNTVVSLKSNDEMAFGILTGNANTEKTEIKKGYRTIYKSGLAVAVYDDKGINILEIEKKEAQRQEEEAKNKAIENEYKNCFEMPEVSDFEFRKKFPKSIEDLENFRKKYPNSKWDAEALAIINRTQKKDSLEKLINNYGRLSDYKEYDQVGYANLIKLDSIISGKKIGSWNEEIFNIQKKIIVNILNKNPSINKNSKRISEVLFCSNKQYFRINLEKRDDKIFFMQIYTEDCRAKVFEYFFFDNETVIERFNATNYANGGLYSFLRNETITSTKDDELLNGYESLSDYDKYLHIAAYATCFYGKYEFEQENLNFILSELSRINQPNELKQNIYSFLIRILEEGNEEVGVKNKFSVYHPSSSNNKAWRLSYLGYLYWATENYSKAIDCFTEANAIKDNTYTKYSSWEEKHVPCSYKEYLLSIHNNIQKKKCELPNEKEMLKKIKNL